MVELRGDYGIICDMRPLRNIKTYPCCQLISRIANVNFFTARDLTPLVKSGYIAVAGGEKNRYLPARAVGFVIR